MTIPALHRWRRRTFTLVMKRALLKGRLRRTGIKRAKKVVAQFSVVTR